jgi:hypothetical protein
VEIEGDIIIEVEGGEEEGEEEDLNPWSGEEPFCAPAMH